MRLLKQKYKRRDGSWAETENYYVRVKDHRGIVRNFPAFHDRGQSEAMGRQLERLVAHRSNSEPLTGELHRWVSGLPVAMQKRLAKAGLISESRLVAAQPLAEHLRDFEQWLGTSKSSRTGRRRSDIHVKKTMGRIHVVFDGCGFRSWSDIRAGAVEQFLGSRDISAKTDNYHRIALNMFAKWMTDNGRAPDAPLASLKRLPQENAEIRRAFTFAEVCRLLAAAERAPRRFGMTGHERAVLYLVALETGLRVSELRSLTVGAFDLDAATATVAAEATKNRKPAVQFLRRRRAEQLRAFFAGKLPGVRAFNMPTPCRTAKMLRADLADTEEQAADGRVLVAAIPYIDDAGRRGDFHSFRHALATDLDRGGASIKVRMAITRHSDRGNITLGVYTHVCEQDLREAVESLPAYPWPTEAAAEAARATGTDGKSADCVLPPVLPSGLHKQGGEMRTTANYGERNAIFAGENVLTENGVGAAENAVFEAETHSGQNGPAWIRTRDQGIMSPLLYR